MGHANGATRIFVNLAGRIGSIITADADQGGNAKLLQGIEHFLHAGFGLGWIGPRRAQDGTAAQVDTFNALDG